MTVHLENAVLKLKKMLLGLAACAEDQVKKSMIALNEKNSNLAQTVISRDTEVDQIEIDIEEECLKILSLYQPVATNLRFVVAVLKINNDLERIADIAVNIAERAVSLSQIPFVNDTIDFGPMSDQVMEMLTNCLDAFIKGDSKLAKKVCRADRAVDQMHAETYKKVDKLIQSQPQQGAAILQLLSISRYLERIADLATNIAEDVIYLVEGKIVRHSAE